MNADEFLELISARRSIRKFADRQPDRATIARLVDAACCAPSNHNRQGWKFVVFEDREEIAALSARIRDEMAKRLQQTRRIGEEHAKEVLHFSGAFDQAPVLILAMHKRSPAVGRSLLAEAASPLASGEALSTAMAVQNLLLAAHALGLGGCVMTAPLLATDAWRSLPELPPGFEPTCLVALGYPAEIPAAPPRKALEHVLEFRNERGNG